MRSGFRENPVSAGPTTESFSGQQQQRHCQTPFESDREQSPSRGRRKTQCPESRTGQEGDRASERAQNRPQGVAPSQPGETEMEERAELKPQNKNPRWRHPPQNQMLVVVDPTEGGEDGIAYQPHEECASNHAEFGLSVSGQNEVGDRQRGGDGGSRQRPPVGGPESACEPTEFVERQIEQSGRHAGCSLSICGFVDASTDPSIEFESDYQGSPEPY